MATREPAPRNATVNGGRTESVVNNRGEFERFLKGYRPADDMFTSKEEIALINKKLGLEDKGEEELIGLRNRVVRYYDSLMEGEIHYNPDGSYAGRSDKYWDYSEGMNSVTAVIDYYRSGRRV